jgi:threonylcarbamoyladenosine tRNA methylthiotransferase MtaB
LLEEMNYRIRQNIASITNEDIFYIMTGRGCLGNCSYCSDLYSCGRLESKPIENVTAEFKQGLNQGYRRFFLVTTDLGVYGKDIGQDLSILLQQLTQEQGDYELLLPNVNPRSLSDMIEDFKVFLRSGKIGLLGVPVQSGSERILEAMGRKHTAQEFKESIRAINVEFPDTTIWTQIMVGFPGETEEDFDATLNLLDEVALDYIQVFRFSRRPTTRASYFENQVSESISVDRYRRALAKAIYKELSSWILRFRGRPFHRREDLEAQ